MGAVALVPSSVPRRPAPIFAPGAPVWARMMLEPKPSLASAAVTFGLLGTIAGLTFIGTGVGIVAMIGGVAAFVTTGFRSQRWVIRVDDLSAEAAERLIDARNRFAYAKRMLEKVPAGITWEEIRADVDTMLDEAATQARHLTAIDAQLPDLAWADAGTPAAALRATLVVRRVEHQRILFAVQREADALSRKAANAAAAATVALSLTGIDARSLSSVVPSAPVIAASSRLAVVQARLDAVAQAWAQLDPTGTIAAEIVRAEASQLPIAQTEIMTRKRAPRRAIGRPDRLT